MHDGAAPKDRRCHRCRRKPLSIRVVSRLSFPKIISAVALAYAAVLKAPKAQPAPSFEQRWGVWGAGYGGSNRTSGDPAVLGSHDLSARVAGFAGGFDYRLSPDTVVGIAFAGGGTDWSLAQGLGGGRSDAFQTGIYGVTRWDPLLAAEDTEKGCKLAVTEHPDVILMDLEMPVTDENRRCLHQARTPRLGSRLRGGRQ